MMSTSREQRRRAFKAEVKATLVPRLIELGYESTRTRVGKESWGEDWKHYGYGRRRDGFVDLVSITWEKWGGPLFRLDYQRMLQSEAASGIRAPSFRSGSLLPPLTILERLFGRHRLWFGERQRHGDAIDQAIAALDQLEEFFRSDVVAGPVHLSQSGDGRRVGDPSAPLRFLGWLLWLVLLPLQTAIFMLTLGGDRPSRGRAD
jgi:hypothetical protein